MILAKILKKAGSHFHRIINPLSTMNDIDYSFIEEPPTYKDLKNCSIFMYNAFELVNVSILNTFRKKLGFTVIVDVDDYWEFTTKHPLYKFYKENDYINIVVLPNIINADIVFTTNERLATRLRNYNSNVFVIKNALNVEEEQMKLVEKDYEFTNLIYSCSASHVIDLPILEPLFRKIKTDNKIKEKLNLVISGYAKDTKKIWDVFYNVFKSSNANVNVIEALDFYQYLLPLDNTHISIGPLIKDKMNYYKSNLKALEAGIKKNVFVTNSNIIYNDLKDEIIITNDWYKDIKSLVNNKNKQIDFSERLYEKVTKEYSLTTQNKLRKEIFDNIDSLKNKLENKAKIYSITYGDNTNNFVTEYEIIHNKINTVEQKSYLFEYNPIINIVKNVEINEEYLGIFSWKFFEKTKISEKEIQFIMNTQKDVYLLANTKIFEQINFLEFTKKVHPNIEELLHNLCNDLNIICQITKERLVYSNFFILKKELYIKYVNEIVIPAIELMETKYKDLAWKDSNYSMLSKEDLKKYTGLDYYPLHTFVLERLFSIWLYNNPQLSVLQYDKDLVNIKNN